jgi:uncharacterized protein involved in exopolysaccharide biosynthesis
MLYSKIIESAHFQLQLLDTPLENVEGVADLRGYLAKKSAPNIFGLFKAYTLDLPSKIAGLFRNKSSESVSVSLQGIARISEEDYEHFKAIARLLTLSINDKEGFVEILAQSENPQVAAQVAKQAEQLLQTQIIAIKTKSSTELLDYLETLYADKKSLLNQAQERLSRFKDRNLSIATSRYSDNQTRLESELQTARAVFQNVVTQLEQVKLQVTKDTPVFSILKPVVFPNEKSGPKRSLTVVVWLLLGLVGSAGFVLAKDPVTEVLQEIKSKA